MTFSAPLTNPSSTYCSICRIRYATWGNEPAKYRGEPARCVSAMWFRNPPVHTVCISLNSVDAGKCHFPAVPGPVSLPCFPPSAINRSARGGGLNWIYLANARARHFHRRFRGKSPAILRGRFKGADVFPKRQTAVYYQEMQQHIASFIRHFISFSLASYLFNIIIFYSNYSF